MDDIFDEALKGKLQEKLINEADVEAIMLWITVIYISNFVWRPKY